MSSTGVSRIEGVDPSVAIKAPCHTITTTNITLSGSQTVGGLFVQETTPKTRVLVNNQNNPVENGPYDVYDTAWRRSDDFNGSRDAVTGTLISITDGDFVNTLWKLETENPVVIGTSSILFSTTNEAGTDRVYTVENVAALASTPVVAGRTYYLKEYLSGDGTGGDGLVGKAGSTTYNNGTTFAGSGGYFERINYKILSIDDFGGDIESFFEYFATAGGFGLVNGQYTITDKLELGSNTTLFFTAGSSITQLTADKQILSATSKENISLVFNNAVLYGEGTWSAGWTGNTGHYDIGIELLGCENVTISCPKIQNCGHDGIYIDGGADIKIIMPYIEGTNLTGTALPSEANFQNGIHIRDSVTYGRGDNIKIIAPEISEVAQGVLRENYGSTSLIDCSLVIESPIIRDIPGQHAFYIQGGTCTVSNATLKNIELSGFKVQSADANQDIRGYSFDGVAYNVGSNLLEIATIGTGSISDVKFNVTGDAIGTGIAINGDVRNAKGKLNITNVTGLGAYVFGDGATDIDIDLTASDIGEDGILITATNADIRISPKIKNVNQNTVSSAISGIRVESASANVELFHPDVTDTGSNMNYGLFNSVAGSIVKVYGSAVFTGAIDTAVRLTGTVTEWPVSATLSGTNGDFHGSSINKLTTPQQLRVSTTSTSTTPVTLWRQTLPDECAVIVSVHLVGKLADSSERKIVVATGCFYRNGGIAVLEGAVDEDVSIASGGFAGVYSLGVAGGNDVVLNVHSGGAATYLWAAKIEVTRAI